MNQKLVLLVILFCSISCKGAEGKKQIEYAEYRVVYDVESKLYKIVLSTEEKKDDKEPDQKDEPACRELRSILKKDPKTALYWKMYRLERCGNTPEDMGEKEIEEVYSSPMLNSEISQAESWQIVHHLAQRYLERGDFERFGEIFRKAKVSSYYKMQWIYSIYADRFAQYGKWRVEDTQKVNDSLLILLIDELERNEEGFCPWVDDEISTES